MADVPTQDEVLSYFETLSNWGRWGDDDSLGTLNLITAEHRLRAASLISEGEPVSCSKLITRAGSGLAGGNPIIDMVQSGERYALGDNPINPAQPEVTPLQWAGERLTFAFHGRVFTHIDGLGHVFWEGRMYNGRSAGLVRTTGGAVGQSSDVMQRGIFTRAVLLDIPRLRGRDYLQPSDHVGPADLDAFEEAHDVRVGAGDVVLLRVGLEPQAAAEGGEPAAHSGWQAGCLPWLHERGVAVIGSDVINDARPVDYPRTPMPVHQVGLVAMGLRLIDNVALEPLAEACAARGRWEFAFSLNPLRIEGGTGSPVNPIAIF